jgi:hypothetical protein
MSIASAIQRNWRWTAGNRGVLLIGPASLRARHVSSPVEGASACVAPSLPISRRHQSRRCLAGAPAAIPGDERRHPRTGACNAGTPCYGAPAPAWDRRPSGSGKLGCGAAGWP